MNHAESKLQQACVAWFRAQYPHYAMLLTHPANEGNGNRVSGAIHKAEGTVAGVPDLLLFMPGRCWFNKDGILMSRPASALGIEMKTAKGSQSQQQKDFQKMFEAAGYMYMIVRSLEEFIDVIKGYISEVDPAVRRNVIKSYTSITKAAEAKEREHFYKVIGKK